MSLGTSLVELTSGNWRSLDRLFRVRGNHVENCWAEQDNITGGAQRERIGIECKMECAHLLKYG